MFLSQVKEHTLCIFAHGYHDGSVPSSGLGHIETLNLYSPKAIALAIQRPLKWMWNDHALRIHQEDIVYSASFEIHRIIVGKRDRSVRGYG